MMQPTTTPPVSYSTTPPTRPLQVSTAPLPGDLRLLVRAQPDARLGMIDVQLAAGKGSRGKGRRALDDPAFVTTTVRRLAASLVVWAAAYEQAAHEDHH